MLLSNAFWRILSTSDECLYQLVRSLLSGWFDNLPNDEYEKREVACCEHPVLPAIGNVHSDLIRE